MVRIATGLRTSQRLWNETPTPNVVSKIDGETPEERCSRRSAHYGAFEFWEFNGVRELRPRKRLSGVAVYLSRFGYRRDHARLALEALRSHSAPWINPAVVEGAIRARIAYGPPPEEWDAFPRPVDARPRENPSEADA